MWDLSEFTDFLLFFGSLVADLLVLVVVAVLYRYRGKLIGYVGRSMRRRVVGYFVVVLVGLWLAFNVGVFELGSYVLAVVMLYRYGGRLVALVRKTRGLLSV